MKKIGPFNLILLYLIVNPLFGICLAGNLVINSMHSDPTAKKTFKAVIDAFKKENPNIKITINTTSHESYKVQIRTWLPNRAPDIATWFAGNRARFFIERGLVEPIDDIWQKIENQYPESIKQAVSYKGKKYLLPTSYYHWGFYYRKDLFTKAGILEAPKTWKSFIQAVKLLSNAKITPVAIGTKNAWPSAAWFDFINMRLNGYDFHMRLLEGQIKYTDPKVLATMEVWSKLTALNAFNKSHPSLTWQEATALIWQGKAAMYLIGNFISTEIPRALDQKIGFFRFPKIAEKQALAEVAPTDVYFIPSKAKNKKRRSYLLSF